VGSNEERDEDRKYMNLFIKMV